MKASESNRSARESDMNAKAKLYDCYVLSIAFIHYK